MMCNLAEDTGCREERYPRFVATLQQAGEFMRNWGKAGKIVHRA